MRIRIQENKLSMMDLIQYPAWEYALDEEAVLGQNEKTLRPVILNPPIDLEKGYYLVRASFSLNDGSQMIGFIIPFKISGSRFMQPVIPYDLHPVIVNEHGQTHFCYGIDKPDQANILENYRKLDHGPEELFPIRFRADIEILNGISEGVLEGFLYFNRGEQDIHKLNQADIQYVK